MTTSPEKLEGNENGPVEIPKHIQEEINNIDNAIKVQLKMLVQGSAPSLHIYKPWPMAFVREIRKKIENFFQEKIRIYSSPEIEDLEKAIIVRDQANVLKKIFSELNGVTELPEGFAEKVKKEIDAFIPEKIGKKEVQLQN